MSVIVDDVVSFVYVRLVSPRSATTDSWLGLTGWEESCRLYTLGWVVETGYVSRVLNRWDSFSKEIVESPLGYSIDDVQRSSFRSSLGSSLGSTNTTWNVRETERSSRF